MTEEEARAWIAQRHGIEATDRVGCFLDDVVAENRRQNLISPASVSAIWVRHALDSAQLLDLAPASWSRWVDVGTGGGFPGMVIALLAPGREVIMVEPRRRRGEFLQHCVDRYHLPLATVRISRVEQVNVEADVISARAVAAVDSLLHTAKQCATTSTRWLLPRGKSVDDQARNVGGMMFHVEHSVTDPRSAIFVATGCAV